MRLMSFCTRPTVAAKIAVMADRKSTRLNSSHRWISYAVFCLQERHGTRVRTHELGRRSRRSGKPRAQSHLYRVLVGFFYKVEEQTENPPSPPPGRPGR